MPARVARVSAVKAEASSSKGIKKVVLAYSGGLDTSVILKWLQDTYNCEVVTFTADLGQVRGAWFDQSNMLPSCAGAAPVSMQQRGTGSTRRATLTLYCRL